MIFWILFQGSYIWIDISHLTKGGGSNIGSLFEFETNWLNKFVATDMNLPFSGKK